MSRADYCISAECMIEWSRYAVQLRDKAESDEIEIDDYLREIKV